MKNHLSNFFLGRNFESEPEEPTFWDDIKSDLLQVFFWFVLPLCAAHLFKFIWGLS